MMWRIKSIWLNKRARYLREKSGRVSDKAHPYLVSGQHKKWQRLMDKSMAIWDKAGRLSMQQEKRIMERYVIIDGEKS